MISFFSATIIPMTDQDALPTLTVTFPLWRWILIRDRLEIVHTHQATSVVGGGGNKLLN
jgi:phosphatidylinositol glycan class A protein